MRDELRESLALLPSRSEPWVGIVGPCQVCVQKLVSGRSARTGALSVEGPAKHELRRTVTFSCQSSEPMVDQRGLADARPGNDCNENLRVFSNFILSALIISRTK